MKAWLSRTGTMLVMIASALTPVQAQEAAGDEGVSARSLQACAFGEVDWEEIEKSLAAIEASEFIDDDEIKAARNAAKKTALLAEASLVLQMMKLHECELPNRAPSADAYLVDALECERDLMRGVASSPECVRANWTSTEE